MASLSFSPDPIARRRFAIAEIDAAVCARLGPTRGLGNSQPACFNRQVAMYLAKHVGGWTTKIIGRYYHGRDHSTVVYSIQRIEAMRDSDADVDALVNELWHQITRARRESSEEALASGEGSEMNLERLADLVAERVCALLEKRGQFPTNHR